MDHLRNSFEAFSTGALENRTQSYHHRPLNRTQQSIRLVSISPDLSPDGYIQCRIRQTTINDRYQCLSYVWGPQNPSHIVLLGDPGNERPFKVGQNLFEFLKIAQRLCRANAIKETAGLVVSGAARRSQQPHNEILESTILASQDRRSGRYERPSECDTDEGLFDSYFGGFGPSSAEIAHKNKPMPGHLEESQLDKTHSKSRGRDSDLNVIDTDQGQDMPEFRDPSLVEEDDPRSRGHILKRKTTPRIHNASDLGAEFWIDAICIDQGSRSERTHQVAQMSMIYSRAYRVITWLGHTASLEPSMGSIHDGLLGFEAAMNSGKNWSDPELSRSLRWIQAFHQSLFIKDFCKNEYWKRAWVTQEIVLARQVFVIIHDSLVDLSLLTSRLNIWEPPSQFNVLREGKVSLWFLLNHLRDQKCSIPHDHIFSVLGLVRGGHNIVVDYTLALETLAYNVLVAIDPRKSSAKPAKKSPQNLDGQRPQGRLARRERPFDLCLCSVLLVIQTLGVHLESQRQYDDGPYVQIEVPALQFSSDNTLGCTQLAHMMTWLRTRYPSSDPASEKKVFQRPSYTSEQSEYGGTTIIRVAFWAALPADISHIVQTCIGIYRNETPTAVTVGSGPWNMLLDTPKHQSVERKGNPPLRENLHITAGVGWSFGFTERFL